MKNHTTGVIFAEGTTVYIDKMGTGRRIAECYAEHLNEDYLTGLREAEANARLFAAAAEMYKALKDILVYAYGNTCKHEDTYRGGALWEICSCCGAKWADDKGGKPDWVEPKEITAAESALAKVDERE